MIRLIDFIVSLLIFSLLVTATLSIIYMLSFQLERSIITSIAVPGLQLVEDYWMPESPQHWGSTEQTLTLTRLYNDTGLLYYLPAFSIRVYNETRLQEGYGIMPYVEQVYTVLRVNNDPQDLHDVLIVDRVFIVAGR